jgi:hypothetical protein
MLLRSTWVPEATGPKMLAVFDETKRRPLTRVRVRCEPSEKKSTKVWAGPKEDWAPTPLLPGGPKAGSSCSAWPILV